MHCRFAKFVNLLVPRQMPFCQTCTFAGRELSGMPPAKYKTSKSKQMIVPNFNTKRPVSGMHPISIIQYPACTVPKMLSSGCCSVSCELELGAVSLVLTYGSMRPQALTYPLQFVTIHDPRYPTPNTQYTAPKTKHPVQHQYHIPRVPGAKNIPGGAGSKHGSKTSLMDGSRAS